MTTPITCESCAYFQTAGTPNYYLKSASACFANPEPNTSVYPYRWACRLYKPKDVPIGVTIHSDEVLKPDSLVFHTFFVPAPIPEGLKDLCDADGRFTFMDLKERMHLDEAEDTAINIATRLLTIEEWKALCLIPGWKETLNPVGYWSSSVFSSNRNYAWLFYGYYGNVYYGSRNLSGSVRCVGL